MSDKSQGPGWWLATNGKWYAPEQHPDYVASPARAPSSCSVVPKLEGQRDASLDLAHPPIQMAGV